jgi:hypothetical protein
MCEPAKCNLSRRLSICSVETREGNDVKWGDVDEWDIDM